MSETTTFVIKRIYELPDEGDGYRVLVDRLWPRGVKKEAAEIDLWAKDMAPSPLLRKWFNHEPEKFDEFREHYMKELSEKQAAVESDGLTDFAKVTLLYAARDEVHNHAIVLRDFLSG